MNASLPKWIGGPNLPPFAAPVRRKGSGRLHPRPARPVWEKDIFCESKIESYQE